MIVGFVTHHNDAKHQASPDPFCVLMHLVPPIFNQILAVLVMLFPVLYVLLTIVDAKR